MPAKKKSVTPAQGKTLEAQLWDAADKMRNNMDEAEYSRAERERLPQAARRVNAGGVHQFHTPSCVVRCLVEMLAPCTALRGSAFLQGGASPQVVSAAEDNGRIYDPACGSGGIPRHSESRSEAETARGRLPTGRAQRGNFGESQGGTCQCDCASFKSEATLPGLKGKLGDISIYGEDRWSRRQRPFGLARRARRVRLRGQQSNQSNVQHPDLRANPPCNGSDTAVREA